MGRPKHFRSTLASFSILFHRIPKSLSSGFFFESVSRRQKPWILLGKITALAAWAPLSRNFLQSEFGVHIFIGYDIDEPRLRLARPPARRRRDSRGALALRPGFASDVWVGSGSSGVVGFFFRKLRLVALQYRITGDFFAVISLRSLSTSSF